MGRNKPVKFSVKTTISLYMAQSFYQTWQKQQQQTLYYSNKKQKQLILIFITNSSNKKRLFYQNEWNEN